MGIGAPASLENSWCPEGRSGSNPSLSASIVVELALVEPGKCSREAVGDGVRKFVLYAREHIERGPTLYLQYDLDPPRLVAEGWVPVAVG